MTPPSDPNRLLDDTLAPDEAFREASLIATLHAVRSQSRARRRRRVLVPAVGILLLAITGAFLATRDRWVPATQPVAESSPVEGLQIVTTRPLPSHVIVTTHSGGVDWVVSEAAGLQRVATTDRTSRSLTIDDAGLFTLLAGRPAAIVRPVGARAELLLLDSGDLSHQAGQ